MTPGTGTANPSFEPIEAKMLAETLPREAIDTFRHYWSLSVRGETGLLPESALEPASSLPDSEALAESGTLESSGARALGETVVLKLNGGLGTSMGMTKAKSLLPVKDGATFLDVTVRQLLHLREEYDCRLPLLLMNSFRTRDDSLALLARYPELASDLPPDFLQHKVPKILASDHSPADWPEDRGHEWCPPGHGDIYTALVTSGMLERLLERGFRFAFVSNSDNLGAVLDLPILGWFADEEAPFLMEVADRTEADRKGGHLACRVGGGLVLREVAQCPEDEMAAFQDIDRYRYFNTNNLWVNLPALADTLEKRAGILGLPMLRNVKTLDPNRPDSPKVLQLETAMGAAISVFDGARAIRVPRERFVPVKTTNDLLAIRSDLYELSPDHRILPAAGRSVGDLVIDLDPAHYARIADFEERFLRGAPSLVECRRLQVRGDFEFGAGIVMRGDVRLENPGPGTRRLNDGEVFG